MCDTGKGACAGGSYADVYKGMHLSKPVALKRLRIFTNTTPEERDKLAKVAGPLLLWYIAYFDSIVPQKFLLEALIWLGLRHPHVLPLLGISSSLFSSGLCMVLPWMENGNLRTYMQGLKSQGCSGDALRRKAAQWVRAHVAFT